MPDPTLRAVASHVHRWLDNPPKNGRLLVITESHDRAFDYAKEITRLRLGDFAATNVPFESMPALFVNGLRNAKAYVVYHTPDVSTLLTTAVSDMQPDTNLGNNLVEWDSSEEEVAEALKLQKSHAMTPDATQVATRSALDTAASIKTAGPAAPNLLIVDHKDPDWARYRSVCNDYTQLDYSDRTPAPEGPSE